MAQELVNNGEVRPLKARKISQATAEKFGYKVGKYSGKPVQIAPYYNDAGQVVAQKIRFQNKDFVFVGKPKEATLFGQQLWRNGGKRVVITEGEIDAMSVSQLQGNKWPVVSVPHGAQGAKRDLEKHLDWLEQFEEIVLMFDMDEPGQAAARKCAMLFTPGKAKIARLPLKDANEMLQEGRGKEVVEATWEAKEARPDGIVAVDEIIEDACKPVEWGKPWWLSDLTKATYGRRVTELYALGAGTGVGKTDFFTQQIAYDIVELNEKVGVVYLEQPVVETAKRIAGKIAGKQFHVPDADWTQEELTEALKSIEGKLLMYDHFGETSWDVVKSHVRYMAVAHGIQNIYIDHLTAMADTSQERESLEQIMKEMAGLASQHKLIIHFISHLATPEGKPHEEGGRVQIRHFKGSRAIGFWSYFMFGMERDQQAEDVDERNTTTFRVLKDRYTGRASGNTYFLSYDHSTGMLVPHEECPFDTNETGEYEDVPF